MRQLVTLALTAFAFAATAIAQTGKTSSVILRTHSITMPYIDDELQNRWFDFGGNTIINTNCQIRLTSNCQLQVGYLWSRLPITAPDFEVEFEFKVMDPLVIYLVMVLPVMWLSKDRAMEGTVFGLKDRFEGLGIFFDTYDNERSHRHTFPYISSMLGDGLLSYDNDKDGRTTELAGCEADFRAKSFPTRARLTFYKNNYLQFEVQWRDEESWDQCFKVSDVKLPNQFYLGFTAHTGDLSDNHDIIAVTTRTLVPVDKVVDAPKVDKKPKKSSSGFFSFIIKIVLAAGLVGVLFVGYRMYEKNNQMKRF
ncbi:unnamed protein product [Cunninghamella echinulata]